MRQLWSKKSIYQALCRKKALGEEINPEKEKFSRVLNVFDLTALGIGATLGCGVYVLAGTVAKSIAGPAVVVSFIVAAIVSSFSGVCYAEFAGRVPKAGSAYVYSYVTVGEFIAFIIGWDLFIEHLIGTASVAKAMTNYLDSLLGNPQKNFMKEHFPMHLSFLGEYPDIASFLFIMSIALIVAWGVRKSSTINMVFTVFNLLTVGTVIVSGLFFGDLSNWSIPKRSIPHGVNGGNGGFVPFGWTGIVAGAAKCFYGFIGFESVSTTGEETKNPKKTIPVAILLSLFVVTLAYAGVASVLTLMWPYYDQDPEAPLPVIYENLGMPVIKYIVTGGAIFALLTSLLGCVFPLPRILYSMSSDGLLFSFLSTVNERTKTPVVASVVCGVSAGILSSIFNLDQLVDMASIGTLTSYWIVCVCVLVLRYRNNSIFGSDTDSLESCTINKWFNLSNRKIPNADTQYISRVLISIYILTAFVFCFCLVNINCYDGAFHFPLTIAVDCSLVVLLITMAMLSRLPNAIEDLSFKVSFVPLVPCLSILFNLYLMMELSFKTWIRFGMGLFIGVAIYIFYGIKHSLEGIRQREIKEEEYKKSRQKMSF